jgi:hypothetical protein
MIAAWPAFSGAQLTHDLVNQQNAISSFQQEEQLADSATMTLDTGTETLSFPLSHLKAWATNYLTSVGWNLKPPKDDAPAQLLLIIPGRSRSPSWGTPGDPHRGAV